MEYISAAYFAIVTCTTVGYGDIEPSNIYETICCFVIMLAGNAVFTYTISNLSFQFGELRKGAQA